MIGFSHDLPKSFDFSMSTPTCFRFSEKVGLANRPIPCFPDLNYPSVSRCPHPIFPPRCFSHTSLGASALSPCEGNAKSCFESLPLSAVDDLAAMASRAMEQNSLRKAGISGFVQPLILESLLSIMERPALINLSRHQELQECVSPTPRPSNACSCAMSPDDVS